VTGKPRSGRKPRRTHSVCVTGAVNSAMLVGMHNTRLSVSTWSSFNPRASFLLPLVSTPRFSPFLACLSFCREFGLWDAPETRTNRGGDFLSIYKRNHFVESWSTGRDNQFRVALRQKHWLRASFPTMLRMPNSA
jgi:hypothetical protein